MKNFNMEKRILILLSFSGVVIFLNPTTLAQSTTETTTTQQKLPSNISDTSNSPETAQSSTTPNTTLSSTTQSSTTPETTTDEPSTTPSPTTPTTTVPTTEPPPINIGASCVNASKCGANAACTNGTCQCEQGYFKINGTSCGDVNEIVVRDLRTTSSTESSIAVAWTQPTYNSSISYTISYHIEIWSYDHSQNQSVGTPLQNYTFDNLTSGTLYTISVQTVLNGSIFSNTKNITNWTIPETPECPEYRSNYSSPNVTVNLTSNGREDGYNVSVITANLHVIVVNQTIQIFGTDPGINYTFEMNSYVILNGTTVLSNSNNCTIRTESGAPDKPENVTNISISPNNISFTIIPTNTPRGDIIQYFCELSYKNYEDQEYQTDQTRNLNVTDGNMYTLSDLKEGAYYLIQIFTVNDGFTSSESYNLTRRLQEGAPEKVTHNTSTSQKRSVDVFWNRPDIPKGDITGYRLTTTVNNICREYILSTDTANISPNCSDNTTVSVLKNQKQMTVTVNDLAPFESYIITIWAYTSTVGEALSFDVKTLEAVPYQPTSIGINAIRQNEIDIAWEKPSVKTGNTLYNVSVFDNIYNENASAYCMSHGFENTSCTVTGLRPFWKYKFKVTAITSVGSNSSEYSEEKLTKPDKPGKIPRASYYLQNEHCQLTLRWSTLDLVDRHSNVTQYHIFTDSSDQIFLDENPSPFDKSTKKFTKVIKLQKKESGHVQVKIYAVGENVGQSVNFEGNTITTSECYEPLTAGEIVGIVVLVMLVVVVLGLGGFIAYRKKESILEFVNKRRGSDGEFEPLQQPERNRPIVLNDIGDFLRKYHADDNRLFMAEYEDLKQLSPRHATNAANLDENKPKNRYTNILPYDHSRVILAPSDDEESSDYINANYIPGYTYGKEYIASQGPLPGTVDDFWKMVWEQSVSIIVMLTKCDESNMNKCEHYWPFEVNEPKCYDDFMVNVTSISHMDKYDINIMDLSFGDEKRVVKHFHFLEWPDFSAKVETSIIIDLINTVRSHITPDIKGPTITHCSAGVGRTGTFITVDYLMQFVRDHDFSSQVDIFDWVLSMREHRTTMVQTWTQYAFIHDCLAELVERKKRALSLQNGDCEVAVDNPVFEPDDLYENTKFEVDPQNIKFEVDHENTKSEVDPKTEL